MAGIPHDHYEPKTGIEKWLHSRLPVVSLIYDTLMIPTPKNLNWMWIWGIVLAFCLALQIVTGIVLVMHYTPHVDLAFASVGSGYVELAFKFKNGFHCANPFY